MHVRHRLLSGAFAAGLMLAVGYSAMAQKAAPGEDPELLAAIRKDIEAAYAPLEAVLKADKSFYDRLTAELKAASSEKDPSRRKAALSGYASKYSAEYGKFAAKAGLRMDQVVAGLNARYKAYEFQTANTYGIVFGKKKGKIPPKSGTPDPTGTRVVQLSFNSSRQESCGGISGSQVLTRARSLEASSWAGVVGDCVLSGDLAHVSVLPATARSIKLVIHYTMEIEGGAVGVVGASMASAFTTISASIGGRLLSGDWPMTYDFTVAPILWSTSFNDAEDQRFELDLTNQRGSELRVSSSVYSSATAILCCGTGSAARMSFRKAELTIVE